MKKKNHEDGNKRVKKKQKLQSPAAAAEPEPAPERVAKHKEKKKENGGGDGRRRSGIITDERFTSAQSDPRFQRMPKREPKVVVDSRFARMLTDESFTGSAAPVDKRGRPRKGDAINPMLRYYLHEEEAAGEGAKMKIAEKDEEMLMEAEDESDGEEKLSGPGSDADISSSSEDDDGEDDDDQCSVNSDIAHYLMANHEDTPTIDHETHRLAIVNLDWGHIKAVDLYVVINSCLPKGGQLLSVAIYPSEFGLKCMEVEAVRGPSTLFASSKQSKKDGSETDDEETDDEELQTYELSELRYYYAVAVCDSSATANHVYKTLDGTEFLSTSNVFDLRFIPDSMEFEHPPRDITTEAPTSYKEPDYHTRALQHSKVKLTWEEDEPDRKKMLRRKFNPDQLDEFDDYLASTGESDSDDDENDKDTKKRIARDRLLSLCQPEDNSDAAHSDDGNDMEITFSTGLEDLSKHILEKKDKKSETVWEAVLRKKNEKKKAWKKRSKHSSEDDSSDYDVQEMPDQPDDFFIEDEPVSGTNAKISNTKTKGKSKKRDKSKSTHNGRQPSPETNKEQEASRAELELLLAGDQATENAPKGYNMKTKKVKGKKGKKGKDVPVVDKLPDEEYKNDPRFASLLSNPLYALDPTDPQFKRSAAYARQRSRKHETGGMDKATTEEASRLSERDHIQPDEEVPDKNSNLPIIGNSSAKERYDFSSTVRSLKRNLGAMKQGKKSR